jgi:hypothetical protein
MSIIGNFSPLIDRLGLLSGVKIGVRGLGYMRWIFYAAAALCVTGCKEQGASTPGAGSAATELTAQSHHTDNPSENHNPSIGPT